MARFTQARVERWAKDVAKARDLLARVRDDQRAAYQAAKGGRFTDISVCLTATNDAYGAAGEAARAIDDLEDGEARRRKP